MPESGRGRGARHNARSAHGREHTTKGNAMDDIAKTVDIAALGELVVDFTQVGTSPAGRALFERNPGGAPANVLAHASRLGLSTQFIGKVGADAAGSFLRSTLEDAGVGTDGLLTDAAASTTLAFVEVSPSDGERSFSFMRAPGADTLLRADEVGLDLLHRCRILHVGSLSLTSEPARSTTLFAVEEAGEFGALISYDPNYRADVWPSRGVASDEIAGLLAAADLVKINREEVELVCGTVGVSIASEREAAETLLARGPRLVAITLGAQGAYLATRGAQARVAAVPCEVVDTTGAGDAFWGAALAWLVRERGVQTAADLDALSTEDLAACGSYACTAAAACVGYRGAWPWRG